MNQDTNQNVSQGVSGDVQALRDRVDELVAQERAVWRQRVTLEAMRVAAWEAYDAGRGSREQVEAAIDGARRAAVWEAEAVDARGQAWADLVAALPPGQREAEHARLRAALDAPVSGQVSG